MRAATESIETLIEEYFDILPPENTLIDDTVRIIIPSVRPSRANPSIPTITPSTTQQQERYVRRLCDTINGWAKNGPVSVQGRAASSTNLGGDSDEGDRDSGLIVISIPG